MEDLVQEMEHLDKLGGSCMLFSMFMVIHALFHVHGGLLFDMFTVVVLHSMRRRGLFSHVLGCS